MEFFNVKKVSVAKEELYNKFKNYSFGAEEVNILDALDRTLSEEIISNINVPEFNRSTVDGYAIKSSDSHGASETMPSFLNVVGEVKMGEVSQVTINPGEAAYVPTGGMIPKGADGVVMIEHIDKLDDNTIFVFKPITVGENMIYKGDDIKSGEAVLNKNKVLNGLDIGSLAAMGISNVKVYKRPKFSIISTGDEIIDLDEELEMGKIRDINGYALDSLVKSLGGEVVLRKIVKDDFHLLQSNMSEALDISDIILISGGSSVGARDYTCDVINSFKGEGVFVHGVSIKPGKPTIMGEGNGKMIFGLPGHPVSSIVVFKVFVEDIVRRLMGIKENKNTRRAIIDYNFHSNPGKETYQMVILEEREDGLVATPNFGKSGMITLLSKSSGYIVIGEDEEGVNKGEEREVYLF